jgi:hypothetical protein
MGILPCALNLIPSGWERLYLFSIFKAPYLLPATIMHEISMKSTQKMLHPNLESYRKSRKAF